MVAYKSEHARAYPKLPVLGWATFGGERTSPLPSVLDAPNKRYTISGRAAIAHALRVLNVAPGDKVLVPTYHCPTMISPVVQAGAEPMFYPITAAGAPDSRWLEAAAIDGVRAMLAAHYFGLPQSMSGVREFCTARGIALIEDCAHAFFGVSDGRPVGSWGDVAIASLTKFFPVPEGGLIVSHSQALDQVSMEPRGWLGQIKVVIDAVELGVMHRRFPGLNGLLGPLFGLKDRLRHQERQAADSGSASRSATTRNGARLSSLSHPALAARSLSLLAHRARIVALRQRNYVRLAEQLANLLTARPLRPALPQDSVPYVFPLYVDDPAASYQRLRATGIPIFCWDEVWPGTPRVAGDCGLDWSTRVFQLGCHQDLSLEDVDAIAQCVREVLGRTSGRGAGIATQTRRTADPLAGIGLPVSADNRR